MALVDLCSQLGVLETCRSGSTCHQCTALCDCHHLLVDPSRSAGLGGWFGQPGWHCGGLPKSRWGLCWMASLLRLWSLGWLGPSAGQSAKSSTSLSGGATRKRNKSFVLRKRMRSCLTLPPEQLPILSLVTMRSTCSIPLLRSPAWWVEALFDLNSPLWTHGFPILLGPAEHLPRRQPAGGRLKDRDSRSLPEVVGFQKPFCEGHAVKSC